MPNETTRVLLVEDDLRIRVELLDALRGSGFHVACASDVAEARAAMLRDQDLVLLDLGLPDGDGLDLCRDLRACGRDVPIIVLTARDAPEQRVRGLDVGADDYVVKPFHMPELLARIRSVLRRARGTLGPGRIVRGSVWADPDARVAGVGERALQLAPREFDLLLFFLRHPDRTWSREQLLDRVWGAAFDGGRRTVDLHVSRLRVEIEANPADPRLLKTVWGAGYRLEADAP
ncbi:MAG: response regulator transcription factor [Planctomycetota bacterium]